MNAYPHRAWKSQRLVSAPEIPFSFKAKWFAIGAAVMMFVGRVL